MNPWHGGVTTAPEPTTRPLDLSTQRPVYTDEPAIQRPQRLASHEHTCALAAMHHARARYPGVVAEVLAEAIAAYKELGCVAQPSAPVVRLIKELLTP